MGLFLHCQHHNIRTQIYGTQISDQSRELWVILHVAQIPHWGGGEFVTATASIRHPIAGATNSPQFGA